MSVHSSRPVALKKWEMVSVHGTKWVDKSFVDLGTLLRKNTTWAKTLTYAETAMEALFL